MMTSTGDNKALVGIEYGRLLGHNVQLLFSVEVSHGNPWLPISFCKGNA